MRARRDICKKAGQAFLGGTGVSKIKATGDIYQLIRVSGLADVYGQVHLGWALANWGNRRLRTKRHGLMLTACAVRIQLR